MRSIAEIDRDHEGMGDPCVRQSHGCTYPGCNCDRSKREIPNVRGVGGPMLTREQIEQRSLGVGVPANDQPRRTK
jgi:hypothetical protein